MSPLEWVAGGWTVAGSRRSQWLAGLLACGAGLRRSSVGPGVPSPLHAVQVADAGGERFRRTPIIENGEARRQRGARRSWAAAKMPVICRLDPLRRLEWSIVWSIRASTSIVWSIRASTVTGAGAGARRTSLESTPLVRPPCRLADGGMPSCGVGPAGRLRGSCGVPAACWRSCLDGWAWTDHVALEHRSGFMADRLRQCGACGDSAASVRPASSSPLNRRPRRRSRRLPRRLGCRWLREGLPPFWVMPRRCRTSTGWDVRF